MSIQYDSLSFVIRSRYRAMVLVNLAQKPQTPTQLASDMSQKSAISHASRALTDLKGRGMVELLVSEDTRKGRIYGLTDKGGDVLDKGREIDAFDGIPGEMPGNEPSARTD